LHQVWYAANTARQLGLAQRNSLEQRNWLILGPDGSEDHHVRSIHQLDGLVMRQLPYVINRSREPPRGNVFAELISQVGSRGTLQPWSRPGYSKAPPPGNSFVVGEVLRRIEQDRNSFVLTDIGKTDKTDLPTRRFSSAGTAVRSAP
jgi:hypothetical protein